LASPAYSCSLLVPRTSWRMQGGCYQACPECGRVSAGPSVMARCRRLDCPAVHPTHGLLRSDELMPKLASCRTHSSENADNGKLCGPPSSGTSVSPAPGTRRTGRLWPVSSSSRLRSGCIPPMMRGAVDFDGPCALHHHDKMRSEQGAHASPAVAVAA
jgi:hypothetical protein